LCGICGIFSFNGVPADSTRLEEMMEAIKHRGPDSKGLHVDGHVGVGVRRLSIIDLKTGDQPVHNENYTAWIVFNGEIYNYKELREKALEGGHTLYTQSDTEVILHLYEMYGAEAIRLLDGMFAICIWDKSKDCLLLARDSVGEKPLYYVRRPNEFVFGSEPKAILAYPSYVPVLDACSLEKYLVLGYVPSPSTIYRGMGKLSPGQMMIVNGDGTVTVSSFPVPDLRISETKASATVKEAVTEELKRAVESRQVADVPIGVLLSGGIDSSLVASFVCETGGPKTINAFTMGFDNAAYDESDYALEVAEHLGIKTNLKKFKESEVVSYVGEALSFLDEPIADPSFIPTYLVSKMASEKVKVVLTGDGGDEMFGGYPKYAIHMWLGVYDRLPALAKNLLGSILRVLPEKFVGVKGRRVFSTLGNTVAERNMLWVSPFLPSELSELLLRPSTFNLDELRLPASPNPAIQAAEAAMGNDARYALGDLFLQKVDRASMACSIESRAPFLAPNIIQLVRRLPRRYKVGFFRTKILLKDIALDRLPREAVLRKKRGFGIPLASLLKGPLKGLVVSALSKERIEEGSLFSYQKVKQLLDQHLKGMKDNSTKIWTLFVFQVWYEKWLRGTTAR
jgi:asparagine synthase (glutamine-hydrolysing)